MIDLKFERLWEAYGPLLTAHQREICELYYRCDLSLTEIAEQKGVSKQSVSDTLAKSRALLEEYEQKLQFVGRAAQAERRRADAAALVAAFADAHPQYRAETDAMLAALSETETDATSSAPSEAEENQQERG